jgi:hypothetical protein
MSLLHAKARRASTQSTAYHDPIRRIIVWRNRIAARLKVVWNLVHGSLVQDATSLHEDQTIERVENLGRWLVDRKEHTSPGIGHFLENLAQLHRRIAVKSASGFVKEHQSRFLQ